MKPKQHIKHKKKKLDARLSKLYGLKAQKILSDLVLNKLVKITIAATDAYDRKVAIVEIDGKNASFEQLSYGLAQMRFFDIKNSKSKYYYPQYKKLFELFSKVQEAAKSEEKGIWKDKIWEKIYD